MNNFFYSKILPESENKFPSGNNAEGVFMVCQCYCWSRWLYPTKTSMLQHSESKFTQNDYCKNYKITEFSHRQVHVETNVAKQWSEFLQTLLLTPFHSGIPKLQINKSWTWLLCKHQKELSLHCQIQDGRLVHPQWADRALFCQVNK